MTALAQFFWLLVPLAIVLSAGLSYLLVPVAMRYGWVDHPGERKVHEEVTPILGGAAVFGSILVVGGIAWTVGLIEPLFLLPVFVGAIVLLIVGLVDDLKDLSAPMRFLLQMGVSLAIILVTSVRLDDFGRLFSGDVLELAWLAIPITLFASLGVINSFNLIDGLDGLSGTMFLLTAAGMAGFAAVTGQGSMFWFLLISGAAVSGFLLLNARFPWNDRARIFLGNSGSMMLGLMLAWSLVYLGSGPNRSFMPMTAVWLFAVPLLDASSLIWRRWGEGRSAFTADQNHLHHAFLRAGYSVNQTVAGMVLLAAVLALVGIVFEFSAVPEHLSFYGFMAVAFTYYYYLKHCWSAQKFLGRHFIHHDFVIEDGYA